MESNHHLKINSFLLDLRAILPFEQITRIELASSAWQADALTVVLYLQFVLIKIIQNVNYIYKVERKLKFIQKKNMIIKLLM